MTTNKQCLTRLQKEYKALLKDPVPHITAHPSNSLLEWHFVLEGANGTDYENGIYHGKLVFPPQYPFKPPSISLFTPNGRFAVNTKLCLSMTDYHPESWNPMWSVGTILTGLLSFMLDPQPTTGSIITTPADKKRFAADSMAFNMKNPTFRKLFPNWVEAHEAAEQQHSMQQQQEPVAPGAEQQEDTQQQEASTAPKQQHAAEPAKPGHGTPQKGSSSAFTLAVVFVLLAMAIVPLLSAKAGLRLPGS